MARIGDNGNSGLCDEEVSALIHFAVYFKWNFFAPELSGNF